MILLAGIERVRARMATIDRLDGMWRFYGNLPQRLARLLARVEVVE